MFDSYLVPLTRTQMALSAFSSPRSPHLINLTGNRHTGVTHGSTALHMRIAL
jgi:hypothetical protein